MDPQATLEAMLRAIRDREPDEAVEMFGYLATWLQKNGFAPDFRVAYRKVFTDK